MVKSTPIIAVAILTATLACRSSDRFVAPVPQTLTVGLSAGADHASIQPAVNAAPAGSTILIEPGTYAESVFIDKSLSIIGSGPNTIVEYPATGVSDTGVIEIRDTFGVHIEALSVRSTPAMVDGIRVRDSTGVTLQSVVASNNSSDGIDIRRSADVDVLDSTLEANGSDGLQVDEFSSSLRVLRCHAASNLVDGIKFRNSSNALIENNTAALNGDDGILIRDATGVEVTANTATNNGSVGIKVVDSPDTVLANNTASGNTLGDIVCEPLACP